MDTVLIKYAFLNFLFGIFLFYVGRTIHEYGHFFVAKLFGITNIKIDLNLVREPFRGANITFDDKHWDKLTRNKKFTLLWSGLIPQHVFYFFVWGVIWIMNFDFRFEALFSLVMFVLIIPEWIVNFRKGGDLYRLVRL